MKPSLERLLLLFFVLAAPAGAQLVPKQVAAQPDDITSGRLRLPAEHVQRSRAAWLPLAFEPGASGTARARLSVPLERPPHAGPVELALVGPGARDWSPRATGAGLAGVALDELARAGAARAGWQSLDELAPGWDVKGYALEGLVPGELELVVDAPLAPGSPGFLVVGGGADVTLVGTLVGTRWTAERELAFRARFEGAGATLDTARVVLETPSGPAALELLDDGLGADLAAGDGTFSGAFVPGVEGELLARIEARGTDALGAPVLRTTQLAVPVLAPLASLGEVVPSVLDPLSLALDTQVRTHGARRVQLSCEVWGERPGAGPVPVVWLSRMSAPLDDDGTGEVPVRLVLDGRWLDASGVAGGLELRNVRLQDPDTHAVLDLRERVVLAPVVLPALVGSGGSGGSTGRPGGLPEITPDMLSRRALEASATPTAGPSRVVLAPAPRPRPRVRSLMLVHGYCASTPPWPAAQFSQPKSVFLDADQNRSHDAFAQLLAAFAADQGLDSFGVVAHSQGGMAALHLYTFYESGLDLSFGGRRIQSVGSPYQGTPLASLGFFACGVNNDMTPAGSAAWLSTIPSAARSQVSYWTTSNSGSVCQFLTSLVLASPNDGVVEMARGQLPGADNRGHELGWCHSTGMSNPAQYTDADRNAEMNLQAAR